MSSNETPKSGENNAAELPQADFSGFVVSLAQAAAISLGEAPDPITGVRSKNLAHARYSIDLIDMLAQKTRGNLTREEQLLMERLTGDLKLMYVRAASPKG